MPTSYDPYRPHSVARVEPLAPAAPKVEPVPQGTVSEVLSWVDKDKDRAKRALEAEQQNERPRKGLVAELNDRVGD